MTALDPLISASWLLENITAPRLKLIDGSWRMPGQGDAAADYQRRHIPGAVFFDIDAIVDHTSNLPHMAPSPEQFEQQVGVLGISQNDSVIVYDDQGIFSAARVWWTFRLMGHENVAVLNGGLPAWLSVGGKVSDVRTVSAPTNYKASYQSAKVCNASAVRSALKNKAASVIDARPANRFNGEACEPRPGLHQGAMPSALNVPFELLLQEDKTMRPPEEIKKVFEAAGAVFDEPMITTCGSGVTAAILCLALETAGHRSHSLYDGSWAEWGLIRNEKANRAEQFPIVNTCDNVS